MSSNHPWFEKTTWQEAERILGYKVNRRLAFYKRSAEGNQNLDNSYTFPGHQIFTYGEWVQPCSGCIEHEEGSPVLYKIDKKTGRTVGIGCHECGYTGKRRDGMHTPYAFNMED